MASRKPEACFGSSRGRNTKRRLARTISTCPPASREPVRAPASSRNCPSTRRRGASATGCADRLRNAFTTNARSSCSTIWNFLVGRNAPPIDRIAQAAPSTQSDSSNAIRRRKFMADMPPSRVTQHLRRDASLPPRIVMGKGSRQSRGFPRDAPTLVDAGRPADQMPWPGWVLYGRGPVCAGLVAPRSRSGWH